MAGESPDKVEQGKSSGETTEEAEAVATPGKDERLKAAVAAWVAGTGDADDDSGDARNGDGAAERGRTAGSAESVESDDSDGSGDSDDSGGSDGESVDEPDAPEHGEGKTGQSAASGLPVRRKRAAAEERGECGDRDDAERPKKSAGQRKTDTPTTMFGVVRPESRDDEDGTDEEAAARRAERMTSAFFGSSKREGAAAATEPAPEEAADGDPASGEDESPAPGDAEPETEDAEQAGPEADEERQEAREDEPEPEDEPAGETEPEPDDEAEPDAVEEPAGKPEKPSRAEESAARDQPTAVFRTVDPAKAEDAAGDDGAEEEGEAETPASDAHEGDQPTAVFRAVEPAKKPADPRVPHTGDATGDAAETTVEQPVPGAEAGRKSGDEPKPEKRKQEQKQKQEEAAPERDQKAGPDGAKAGSDDDSDGDSGEKPESESETTSQFVPLRSADAPPRTPKKPAPVLPPKPLGKPHATGTAQPEPRSKGRPLPPAAKQSDGAQAPEQTLSEAELTRQQPRPDQAPLDLLAQLTNTPPPPETPLRTAVRRVKIWTPLVFLLAIVFVIAQAVRPLPDPQLKLTASRTYTFDGAKPAVPWPSEGQAELDVDGLGSFGTSGEQKPVPIGSVAKVMTAYIILRDHPVKEGKPGATIPVDQKAEDEAGLSAQNESTVEVKAGDKISEREAIKAIMIASANNVARLLARWDAGSEKAFVKKMNATAKDLGMKNTTYTDPSGLIATTKSTAVDQVKLAKKAMDDPLFRKVVRMPGYTDTKGDRHGNWNKLVPLDGVVGIKTGTTTKAGGNLMFAAEKEIGGTRQLIIGVVLGQHKPSILDTVLAASKKLIDTAQDSLQARKVVHKGDVVGYVDDRLGGRTPVVATKDVSAVGWSGLKVKLGLRGNGKPVPHEGSAGDVVGTLTVGDGPGQVKVPVALKKDMDAPGFGAKLSRIT